MERSDQTMLVGAIGRPLQESKQATVRTRARAANGHIWGCEVDSIWRMIKQQRPKMTQ